jgi:hypothetical protein
VAYATGTPLHHGKVTARHTTEVDVAGKTTIDDSSPFDGISFLPWSSTAHGDEHTQMEQGTDGRTKKGSNDCEVSRSASTVVKPKFPKWHVPAIRFAFEMRARYAQAHFLL